MDSLFLEHFPETISEEIKSYATNHVLRISRYLFTHRKGHKQYAFCTHCKNENQSSGLKHGQLSKCSSCGAVATVKSSGRGRKTLVDRAYLIWYDKSAIDPNILIARGFHVERDYRYDFHKTETEIDLWTMYVFEWGKGGKMAVRSVWGKKGWSLTKNVYSDANHSMKYIPCYYNHENIVKAVNRTPFQYCTWEKYEFEDFVRTFDFAAKYPCMEYLTKLGLGAVISSKLSGMQTFGAINWRGKSIDKVLRLPKSEIKEWLKKPYKQGLLSLYAYQQFRPMGFNSDESHALCSLAEKGTLSTLNSMDITASLDAKLKYILKQLNRSDASRLYYSAASVLRDWQDYLKECKELGIDTDQENVFFPNNLHEAHSKTLAKIKFKRDELLNQKIIDRSKELEKHSFEKDGLMVRPVVTSAELFQEGRSLQHCVGNYAERYGNGHTDIFVVRKSGAPDEPYYTLEAKNGELIQCRGYKNRIMTPDVENFVQLFVAGKLNKKQSTKASQGVAV